MLGPYLFSNTSRETLGDKMELYFHDHSFVPLFIQVCLSYLIFGFTGDSTISAGELFENAACKDPELRWTATDFETARADGQSCIFDIRWRLGRRFDPWVYMASSFA